MKHRIVKFSFFIGALALASSCNDDFEALPVEQYTIDFVFSKTDSLGVNARQYLTTVYSQLQNGHNRVGDDYLEAASDDAVSSATVVVDITKLGTGQYNAVSQVPSDMRWANYYAGIRSATTFVNNIEVVPLRDKLPNGVPMAKVWKSEARFIRAMHYFELLKRYGGVPLMGNDVLELGEDVELPRNTFEECVRYIVGECDAIKDSLRTYPIANPNANSHVATKEAALALKARVLLYAASPLYNGGNIDPNNPLTGYTNYDVNRWKLAADAAKDFLDQNTYFTLAPKFAQLFVTDNNEETIFFRSGGANTNIEKNNGPVGFSGSNQGLGRTSPSQNLVDAFLTRDGKFITDPGSGYNPADPYANRDPRLDATVIHNGSLWLKVTVETFQGGRHRPGGQIQQTKTGYYLRKFMGIFEDAKDYGDTPHDWVVFRYAEILLNRAEAVNELDGPTAEVYDAIRAIRQRAGILSGGGTYGLEPGLTQEQMRIIIRNERRIELAFEEHRYWDIRRWKIAQDVFSVPVDGVVIVKAGATLNYNVVPVQEVAFDEKQYFYPISFDEVIKNSNMVQNPQW
jgi:starch-binding outer membrane protein, SusD/RagB family